MNSSWLDRNRHLIFTFLLLLAVGGVTVFYWQQPSPTPVELLPAETTATSPSTPLPSSTPATVRVYVTGAVVNSDVYILPKGGIIKDAILAAGGFTTDADRERINQALELQDQQQIHVPRLGEANPPPIQSGGTVQSGPAQTGPLNLNSATQEQLEELPGIGPAMAQRIIEYRERVGKFKTVEEITEVSGIGEATFLKIKDLITVQ